MIRFYFVLRKLQISIGFMFGERFYYVGIRDEKISMLYVY